VISNSKYIFFYLLFNKNVRKIEDSSSFNLRFGSFYLFFQKNNMIKTIINIQSKKLQYLGPVSPTPVKVNCRLKYTVRS
jgi:hypothetical protein